MNKYLNLIKLKKIMIFKYFFIFIKELFKNYFDIIQAYADNNHHYKMLRHI